MYSMSSNGNEGDVRMSRKSLDLWFSVCLQLHSLISQDTTKDQDISTTCQETGLVYSDNVLGDIQPCHTAGKVKPLESFKMPRSCRVITDCHKPKHPLKQTSLLEHRKEFSACLRIVRDDSILRRILQISHL